MIEFPDSICPLCSEVFPRDLLRQHIALEEARVRRRTIAAIQSYHETWLEEHGACWACWRSYREAGRMIRILQSTQADKQRDTFMSRVQE